jgi:fumarate reductase flavoprotein subunit
MKPVLSREGGFELTFPVVVIGAGGTGLSAALAVRDAGVEVLVVERDPTPLGSTAMSTGLIPAAGTPEQAAAGIEDSPERFVEDVLAKTKGKTDLELVTRLALESGETITWLRDRHAVPLDLVRGFLYPGHSAERMYGTPHRTGGELIAALQAAAEKAGVTILTDAAVTALFATDDRVTGVQVQRPDGTTEEVGCDALILACSGFGGAPDMVRRFIPEMAEAVFHGHPGNKGDAVIWGEALGAATADMSAYQGHGGLAAGHGIPILWPLIMEGGFQVNRDAERFSNESAGYSEQAAKVNAQPGHVAWSIFDERLHQLMLAFEDYRDAIGAGAVVIGDNVEMLAASTGLPADALAATLEDVERMVTGAAVDPFGRDFTGKPPLRPPYRAAKVTGALFHTQGGLVVNPDAHVLRVDGTPFSNLFAGGGAARSISGPGADGYMAGNGLLTATTLGKIAGRNAAALISPP